MTPDERHIVPAFVVGFGFMRAWALTFLGESGVTPPLSLQISSDMFLVFAPLMLLTTALVMIAASRKSDSWVLSSKALVVSAAVLTAGTCLLVLNGADTSVIAEAICAVGFGVFLLQWGAISSRISVETLTLALSLGFVAAGLLCYLLCFLTPPTANAFFAIFVPISAYALYASASRTTPLPASPGSGGSAATTCVQVDGVETRGIPKGQDRKTPTFVRLFFALFIMEFVARSSLMLSGEYFTSILSYPSSSFELARLVGTSLASTLFIIVAKCSKEPLRTLYLVVPALLVCSCLFLLFEDWGIPFVTYAIAFAAGAWLETVFWIFFSHSHRSLRFPAIVVWGVGRIAFWLSTFVGLMFWSYRTHVGGVVSDDNATMTLVVVMALLSMVVYLFVLPERTVKSFGIIGTEQSPMDSRHATDLACANIAREFGLSKRETEVFSYLAKGRDTAYIQEKLFISSGTVCSHRDRIYRKLGIHSKQELLDLVEDHLKESAPL